MNTHQVFWTLAFTAATWVPSFAQIEPAGDAQLPLSPRQSMAKMRVPKGFRIELVASEPLVTDPVGVAFDEHGRMFVTEIHGFNVASRLDVAELNKTGKLDRSVRRLQWEYLDGRIAKEAKKFQYGTVKLLSDTDGDGRMDTVDIWADDLPPAYNLVAARGGVIVACAPHILFLADRDGDGKAEVRETLFTGFNIVVIDRAIDNPQWSIDNWIYVGAGGGGGTITGPNLPEPVHIGHTDFRIKADGSAIETVSGTVSTFGTAFTDYGDRFPTNSGEPAVYALPLPHRYLKRNPYVTTPPTRQRASDYQAPNLYFRCYPISKPHPWRLKRGQDPAWQKFYGKGETSSGYFSGNAGGQIYRASLFPQRFHGQYFLGETSQNFIHRAVLRRDGPGYVASRAPGEAESEFFASEDSWFRPVNLKIGPDGAMYITDMYREIIEDYSAIPRFLQQQYEVTNGEDMGRIWRLLPASKMGRKVVDLATMGTDELVRTTADRDAWWRQTAQRLLVEQQDHAAAPALATQLRRGETSQARLHALYTLNGLGDLGAADIAHALGDPDWSIRMHALQLSERWFESKPKLLEQVAAMTSDPDVRVRLQLAMTLGESDTPLATTALQFLATKNAHERWMDSAILSSVTDSAGTFLAELLGVWKPTAGTRALLVPLAATVGARRDGDQALEVLRAMMPHEQAVQSECLKGLTAGLSRGKGTMAISKQAQEAIEQLLGSKSKQIQGHALQFAARLGLRSSRMMQTLYDKATRQALDASAPINRRLESMGMLNGAPYMRLAGSMTPLLNSRQSPALQIAAIKTLASCNDPRIGASILNGWKGFAPAIRTVALEAIFARQNRLTALLDAIEAGSVRAGEVDQRRREQLRSSSDAQIAARANTLFEQRNNDAELQQRIALYQRSLAAKGDPGPGKEVFAKNCLICHKLNGEGHQVGPDLASLVKKPDDAILMDILDPSSRIELEYRAYTIATVDGQLYSGILFADSATSVTLRRGEGAEDTILRADIEEMIASELSLMPSNLYEQVSPQNVADLIAYLRKELSPGSESQFESGD